MLRTADNVFSVILDDNSATTAALNATCPVGTVATPANVAAGAILMVDMGMRRLSNATYGTTDRYRIVQGKGAGEQFMMSPVITKANATISTSNHRASVQQVSVVGYNGTANALPAANSTDYFIKIRKNDNDAANRSQPMSLFAGPIKSGASTSQIAIAEALVKNGTQNFKDEPANNYLKFEMLNAGARIAPTLTAAVTLTFTNGSRLVTASAATASTAVAVGDFITVAAATTTAVYKVTAKAANGDLTLSTAFNGTTATIVSSTTVKRITSAAAIAADSGVRMAGIQADFDVNAFRDYYVNRFSVAFSDVSTVVTTAGARTGSGMWEQVAMDEYMSYGFEGMNGMLGVPPAMRDQAVKIPGKSSQTDLTSRYGCLEISWTESIQGLVSLQGGKGSVLIYVNLDNTNPLGLQGNTATSFDLTRTVLLQSATAFNMV
jgi:hypothetical protein